MAIATRFQADRDLVVVSGAQGSKLDPSSDGASAPKWDRRDQAAFNRADGIQRIHVKGIETSISIARFRLIPRRFREDHRRLRVIRFTK